MTLLSRERAKVHKSGLLQCNKSLSALDEPMLGANKHVFGAMSSFGTNCKRTLFLCKGTV